MINSRNSRGTPVQLIRCLVAAVFLAGLPAYAGTGSKSSHDGAVRAVEVTSTLGAPDTSSTAGAYTGVSEYRIGPQDLIDISVFQVEDLNRTIRVNSAGQFSLPLIGVMQAGGRTVQELEQDIATKLSAGYLQNPQVSVFVKEFSSQRVTVEGAVKGPGIYPLTGRTTLLQVIAMAKGLDTLANLKGVMVFRTVGGKKMAAIFDMQAIRGGDVEDPQIYGDDIVVVDQSGAKTRFRFLFQAIPILNLFTPF